jgi:hypothetical protein
LRQVNPQPDDVSFFDWRGKANEITVGTIRKVLNSLFILGDWVLWKHMIRCVFDVAAPRLCPIASGGESPIASGGGETHVGDGRGKRSFLLNDATLRRLGFRDLVALDLTLAKM